MSYCQCEFTRNPHADPRQRRVGRRRRGVDAGRKRLVVYTVGGPGRGPVPRSDDSVEAQCEIRKSHPLPSPSPAKCRSSHPVPSSAPPASGFMAEILAASGTQALRQRHADHPTPRSAPPASGFMVEIPAVGHSGSPTAARRSPSPQFSAARNRLYGRDPRRRALRLSDSGTQITLPQISAARIRLYGRDPRRRARRLSDSGCTVCSLRENRGSRLLAANSDS